MDGVLMNISTGKCINIKMTDPMTEYLSTD